MSAPPRSPPSAASPRDCVQVLARGQQAVRPVEPVDLPVEGEERGEEDESQRAQEQPARPEDAYHQPLDHQYRRRRAGVKRASSTAADPKNSHIGTGWCVRKAASPVPPSHSAAAQPARQRQREDIAATARIPKGTPEEAFIQPRRASSRSPTSRARTSPSA